MGYVLQQHTVFVTRELQLPRQLEGAVIRPNKLQGFPIIKRDYLSLEFHFSPITQPKSSGWYTWLSHFYSHSKSLKLVMKEDNGQPKFCWCAFKLTRDLRPNCTCELQMLLCLLQHPAFKMHSNNAEFSFFSSSLSCMDETLHYSTTPQTLYNNLKTTHLKTSFKSFFFFFKKQSLILRNAQSGPSTITTDGI